VPIALEPVQRSSAATAAQPAIVRGSLKVLLAILALGLALRLWGLNWGLPWVFHPDENTYADRAAAMLRSGDPNPRYYGNPTLFIYIVAAELLLAGALGPLAGPMSVNEPAAANFLARLSSALLGTASLGLVFAIGSTLFCRRAGLIAALFLAVSFLHVRDSHYGVNDVPATTLLLMSLYCDTRLLRSPHLRWYVLAGLTGGLATSTKYNMGLFFVPLLAAHWLARRAGDRLLLVAAAASLAGFFLGSPYALLDLGRLRDDFAAEHAFGDTRKLGQPLEPVPLLYLTSLFQGFGPLPLVLALAGLGLSFASAAGWGRFNHPGAGRWWTHRSEALVVAAFPLAYLAFMLPKARFFPRHEIPLVPFFCLLAGYGAIRLAELLPPRWRAMGLAMLLTAALAQPLANDLLHNRILMQSDTRVLANEWAQASLPPRSFVLVEGYSLRDLSRQAAVHTPNIAELRIERLRSMPEERQVDYLLEQAVDYVVTSSFIGERCLMAPPTLSQLRESGECFERLYPGVQARTELIATFGPGHGGRELPWRIEDVMTPFWALEQYERPGPTLRVYSLAPLKASGP
jgi:4-amino-4-deoxy-L-arabinose transferase-like glycosyltransferase